MTTNKAKSLTCSVNTQPNDNLVWSLYIVQTRHGHWYTGISTDVAKRFALHQSGKGAKNLRGKGPLSLIFQTKVGNRSEATKLEIKIKRLTKAKKQEYVLNQARSDCVT